MEVIRKKLDIRDSLKIFGIIEKTLRENQSTQIFVNTKFVNELVRNGIKDNVYYKDIAELYDRFGSKYKVYSLMHNTKSNEFINRAFFTHIFNDYEAVVEFYSKNFERHINFYEGCEQLLLIDIEK